MANQTKLEMIEDFLAVAQNTLRLTRSVVLTEQKEQMDKESGDYGTLMEDREPMFAKMIALKGLIDTAPCDGRPKLCAEKWQQATKVLETLAELDRQNMEAVKRMRDSVQTSINEIISGKKLYDAYEHLTDQEYTGLLDAKN
jgi:hypothetical protein